MKKLRVGIFGIELESVNFGVTALALTQLQVLNEIKNALNLNTEYYIFSDDSEDTVHKTEEILSISGIIPKYIVRIRTGIPGLCRLYRDIKNCDLVLDLTYGDSFSDLYGLKNFWLYSAPKILTALRGKPLVLPPQTIGPFNHNNTKLAAKYILKRAKCIFTRDELSKRCVEDLTGRKDVVLTSDLAMGLPYEKSNKNIVNGKRNIGFNVSALLWERDSSKLELNLDYRKLITDLLQEFKAREEVVVHLITHVYTSKGFTEYALAEELHKKYPKTIMAPRFDNPIQAKSYMSGLDLFLGSRMHATIGAFSSGVPVIPISYSRKFEGLYGTLGYHYCIDCNKETNKSAYDKIISYLDDIDEMEKQREKSYNKAVRMNRAYRMSLQKLISEIIE